MDTLFMHTITLLTFHFKRRTNVVGAASTRGRWNTFGAHLTKRASTHGVCRCTGGKGKDNSGSRKLHRETISTSKLSGEW